MVSYLLNRKGKISDCFKEALLFFQQYANQILFERKGLGISYSKFLYSLERIDSVVL